MTDAAPDDEASSDQSKRRGPIRRTRRWLSKQKPLGLALVLVVALGLTVALVAWIGLSWILGQGWPWTSATEDTTRLDVTKLALTVVGGAGAFVALTVAYRRQKDLEDGRFTERFGAAAAQLGAATPAERLAGVYAMAGVADRYTAFAQQCIDVLCGYLRLPFDPDPAASHLTTVVTHHRLDPDGAHTHDRTYQLIPNDREVRDTIVRVIAAHVRWDCETGWHQHNFDLTGATLTTAPFELSEFGGTLVCTGTTFSNDANFAAATFSGDASFGGSTFTHDANFNWTRFKGGVDFRQATFAEDAQFTDARFTEDVFFFEASFNRGANFFEAQFNNGAWFSVATFGVGAWFAQATFGGAAWFHRTTFIGTSDEPTSFFEATFNGDASFGEAMFNSPAKFDEAIFNGGVYFGQATFNGDTMFGGATFKGEAYFGRATFNGDTMFGGATFKVEAHFNGTVFSGPAWFDGATFTGKLERPDETIMDPIDPPQPQRLGPALGFPDPEPPDTEPESN